MMPFEVSYANFKYRNKFLFLQYILCFCSFFFFILRTYSPVPVFAFPTFFAHHVLYRHAKKRKRERNTRNLEKVLVMWFCLYFQPCLSLDPLKFLFLGVTSHLTDTLVFDNFSVQGWKPLLIPTSHHPSREG